MKSSRLLWVAQCCLALSLTVIGIRMAPAIASPTSPSSADGVATRFVRQLIRKDFPKAEADFNERMKQAMPIERLENSWTKRTENSGGPQVGEVHDVPYKEYTIVWVKTLVGQDYFWTKVVIDADQKIAGLGFVPSSVKGIGAATP